MTTYRGAPVEAERVVRTKGADQRNRVLAAAVDAIAERGPHRVTVRDIAARAGISPSHVLYYFGRRENILMETLRWSESELSTQRVRELDAADTSTQKLVRFVRLYLPTDPGDVRWNLWNQVIAAPPRTRETDEVIADLEQVWVDDLQGILTVGVATSEFDSVDVPGLALRTRLLMDGVASEVVLGLPGRTSEWAVEYVWGWLADELGFDRAAIHSR